jgi:K+-transporting ATPase ATPase C chain
MLNELKRAVLMLLVLSVLTGLLYPLLVTGIAQVVFPHQANGSLIERDGKTIGSALIGQNFDDPMYFWGRPSASTDGSPENKPLPYNAANSGGSNTGPTNPDLVKAVEERIAALRAADPGNTAPVPVDLVTASASGLDPHISPAAAECQVSRVAKARGMNPEEVRRLVTRHTEGRTLGLLGEAGVNVVELNVELDNARNPP